MSQTKILREGKATIIATANGEVLAAPGGLVYRWTDQLNRKILRATARAAPRHKFGKRPLRPHPGKPLKRSFVSTTPRTRLLKSGFRIYASVGSTARHAVYVDQGTGVFAGNSPYVAKILPPWAPGQGSLYEHTWRPGGPQGKRVRQVLIKGQPGQYFFDQGLRDGFRLHRIASAQIPGGSQVSDAFSTWYRQLEGFQGNTEADAGFVRRLEDWRRWRDKAFHAEVDLGDGSKTAPSRQPKTSTPKPRQRKRQVSQRVQTQIEVAQQQKKKQRAKQREAEEDRRAREKIRQNAQARLRREAFAYAKRIVSEYPNVQVHTLKRGKTTFYRVVFYEADGTVHHHDFK